MNIINTIQLYTQKMVKVTNLIFIYFTTIVKKPTKRTVLYAFFSLNGMKIKTPALSQASQASFSLKKKKNFTN